MKKLIYPIISIILIIILTLNIVFFVLSKISPLLFWIIIATIGILTYKILPKIKQI
jgi:hypothetical protein